MRRFTGRVSLLLLVCAALLMLARVAGTRVDRMQVWVPPGCFMMGSDPTQDPDAQTVEQPQHQVCLTHGFWLDQYEVTNGLYQRFLENDGYRKRAYWSTAGWQWLQDNRIDRAEDYAGFTDEWQPRVGVSWYEAEAYARWRGCRLPTEAEWEYAARGPQSTIYPWGNTWNGRNLNAASKVGRTTRVGSYVGGTSWAGAYDMVGNVWEWTADWYAATYYRLQIATDPQGPTRGSSRVLRGGSWDYLPNFARGAVRNYYSPVRRAYNLGFRVVCPAA